MEVIKLTSYTFLSFVCTHLLVEVVGKSLENPRCLPTKVTYDNTCEVCRRPGKGHECLGGYKCSDVEADNSNFLCYYERVKGWDKYRKQHDITAFEPANHTHSPLPLISAISVYQRNQSDKGIGYPALKVKVNVPYLLYGPGEQNELPESMRMVFSSVQTIEYKDRYYYDNPITRFYHFINYTPTSFEIDHPKQVVFKCLTGLDVCGDIRVYTIQLTTYAHSPRLYLELNFTATAYMNIPSWYPVIATAVLPKNSGVYVVFAPRSSTDFSYEIYLEDSKDRHRKTKVETFIGSVQKYSCVFNDVAPGSYRAKLLVKYTKGAKAAEPTVSVYESAVLEIPGEISTTVQISSQPEDLVIPILVIVASLVIAIALLILLYSQRNNRDFFKKLCLFTRNPEECQKKSFLLYMREAEKFVPNITRFLNEKLSSMKVLCDREWENDHSPPFDLFKVKVKQCSHLLILWSPSAPTSVGRTHNNIEINPNSTVQDYFREAVTFAKDFNNRGGLKIVILFIPGYEDQGSIPADIGGQIFDLTRQCKQLCKYLTGSESEFNAVDNNALQQQIEEILNDSNEENDGCNPLNLDVQEKDEIIDQCPVHAERASLPYFGGNPCNEPEEIPCQISQHQGRGVHNNEPYPLNPDIQGNIEFYYQCPVHPETVPLLCKGRNAYIDQEDIPYPIPQHPGLGVASSLHSSPDQGYPPYIPNEDSLCMLNYNYNINFPSVNTLGINTLNSVNYQGPLNDVSSERDDMITNPPLTVPLSSKDSNTDTDQGYVSKSTMEQQDQFLGLNS